jgi:hypothetical protein
MRHITLLQTTSARWDKREGGRRNHVGRCHGNEEDLLRRLFQTRDDDDDEDAANDANDAHDYSCDTAMILSRAKPAAGAGAAAAAGGKEDKAKAVRSWAMTCTHAHPLSDSLGMADFRQVPKLDDFLAARNYTGCITLLEFQRNAGKADEVGWRCCFSQLAGLLTHTLDASVCAAHRHVDRLLPLSHGELRQGHGGASHTLSIASCGSLGIHAGVLEDHQEEEV